MTFALLNSDKKLKTNPKKNRNDYSSLALIAGISVTLLSVWLLTQLPGVSFWINNIMGQAVFTWLWRVGCLLTGLTVAIALIRAFFAHTRKEFGLGPAPIFAFFLLGLILSLIS